MIVYYQLELDDMVIVLNNKDSYIEQLQNKLDIATKALKEYANEENWRTATTIINTDYFEFEQSMYGLKHSGFEEAQQALKEMEGVK